MLSASFQKHLPNFTLDMAISMESEILAVVGPSGSGKTTFLQCLAGLIKPTSGEIIINRQKVFSSHETIFIPPRIRKIGYVFQDYALFPHMTVKKNVVYGIPNGCKCKSGHSLSVLEVLEMLGITHLQDRYPNQISGGEKQRVALARALMTEPDLLLLDEPLSALDQETRTTLQKELKELHEKWKIPFILVTHDTNEAEYLGDRIIKLDRGYQSYVNQ